MTNIIPQAPKNNQETWANLEGYTRKLVDQGNEVYVVIGNYCIGGTGSNGPANTIDKGRVTVPARIWKVLVILPEGDYDVNRVSTDTRVISVDTPNTNNLNSDWGTFRTTVDAIEKSTGYDLLSNVPEAVQKVIEAQVDRGPTR